MDAHVASRSTWVWQHFWHYGSVQFCNMWLQHTHMTASCSRTAAILYACSAVRITSCAWASGAWEALWEALLLSCLRAGGFGSEEEAARAYDRAAIVYWGDKAKLNVSVHAVCPRNAPHHLLHWLNTMPSHTFTPPPLLQFELSDYEGELDFCK